MFIDVLLGMNAADKLMTLLRPKKEFYGLKMDWCATRRKVSRSKWIGDQKLEIAALRERAQYIVHNQPIDIRLGDTVGTYTTCRILKAHRNTTPLKGY